MLHIHLFNLRCCLLIAILYFLLGPPCAKAHDAGPLRPKLPGIGFNLTPDYGPQCINSILTPIFIPRSSTAAIYFPNGSYIAIPAVQGNGAYRAFMHGEQTATSLTTPQRNTILRTILCTILTPLNLCPPSPTNNPVEPLLTTLKSAAESHLKVAAADTNTYICYAAALSFPSPTTLAPHQLSIINQAVTALNIPNSHLPLQTAGFLALHANENRHLNPAIQSEPDYYLDRVVLSIEHSRWGLSALLLADGAVAGSGDGGVSVLRQVVRYTSGSSSSYGSHSDVLVGEEEDARRAALQKLLQPPFGYSPRAHRFYERVDRVVLYGDLVEGGYLETSGAKEGNEQKMLREILGGELTGVGVFEPASVAAIGAAWSAYEEAERRDGWVGCEGIDRGHEEL
ncbi:hypothetical protein AJ79_03587 [Helicocarpus griseus UAMH5409]|uniref:Uncharacterized protein n=1 Tax=Helicocarpus griseus UAMH5409 TaxID=1447875 RepID=A0A2B7XP92_9EURO|nr:hypothetical protein AJ79_03587 [Helicocarpus griseus UAMH5409]